MDDVLYGSVCRIADLDERDFDTEPVPKSRWSNGDYVVARVSSRPTSSARIEAPTGWQIEPLEGELIVGALGKRSATRGLVGSWEDVEADGTMHVLGGGGVFGKVSSVSPTRDRPIALQYEGHVQRDGSTENMLNFTSDVEPGEFTLPVILVLGTSMSSGKTMTARVLVRALKEMGYAPLSCKLSGSGRYHDVLSMKDAGAEAIFDFVDAGFPTTVVPEREYRKRTRRLLTSIENADGDVLVAEIGASPLEPYNGDTAIELLQDNVQFSIATATDPYSIVGLNSVLDVPIDLVTGIATNTTAGINLIEQITEFPALNLQHEAEKGTLKEMLQENVRI